MKPIVICLLMISLTSGCALVSPTEPYQPIRLSISSINGQASRSTHPSVERTGSMPVDLQEVIAIALESNPEVAATSYDAAAAQARKDEAWGARLPALSAEGSYTRYLDDQRLVPARYNGEAGAYSDSLFSGDLVLRMPLFTGGRLVNEERAAKLLSQAAEHRLGRTREELVFNVTSVFYGILAREKFIESLQFSRKALQSHLQRVNNLVAAQKAAKVDLLRTEVRLSDVEQNLVLEENTLAIQRRVLANLMGIEVSSEVLALRGDLNEATIPPLTMQEGVSAALRQRPDYLAARKDLEARARRVDVARAGHSPTLSLLGAYGGRWAVNSSGRTSGSDGSEDVGRIGIGLEIPLFQGGRVQARVKEERSNLGAAQERLRKLEIQIRLEVETAFLNLASALERVQTLQKSVEQAKESLRIERQKYDLGKGAIVDVLDAQSALLESETNYYRAMADTNIARAQIELALGGTQGKMKSKESL